MPDRVAGRKRNAAFASPISAVYLMEFIERLRTSSPIVVACFVVRLAEKQPSGRLRSDESGLL